MKKHLKILLMVVFAICICGCSNRSQSIVKHCTLDLQNDNSSSNLKVEYILYGQGKYAEKVEIIETMTPTEETDVELFKTSLTQIYSDYNSLYKGFTNKISEENGKIVSKTTIDYGKINLDKYIEDNSAMKKYYVVENKKLVFDGIQELYESLGSTCK